MTPLISILVTLFLSGSLQFLWKKKKNRLRPCGKCCWGSNFKKKDFKHKSTENGGMGLLKCLYLTIISNQLSKWWKTDFSVFNFFLRINHNTEFTSIYMKTCLFWCWISISFLQFRRQLNSSYVQDVGKYLQ